MEVPEVKTKINTISKFEGVLIRLDSWSSIDAVEHSHEKTTQNALQEDSKKI